MRSAISALTVLLAACLVPAHAKLPPPSDEAKAKAAEAAAKGAWSDKVGAYKLCRAMDRTAESYRHHMKATGKETPAPTETPACVDPGPYVAVAAPPLEASGAHSPPATATAPPSSKATSAQQQGTARK
jgi:hypothetical protein